MMQYQISPVNGSPTTTHTGGARSEESPLARRPYDLRHAALSTWLNAGVPPTQVAEWAGHSVMVLLRVYAKCIYGQEEMARARIESALALPTTEVPDVAQTYRRITGEQP